MGKVQILAVLTMDGCLSSELYDKAHQDLCLDRCGLDEIRLYQRTAAYARCGRNHTIHRSFHRGNRTAFFQIGSAGATLDAFLLEKLFQRCMSHYLYP